VREREGEVDLDLDDEEDEDSGYASAGERSVSASHGKMLKTPASMLELREEGERPLTDEAEVDVSQIGLADELMGATHSTSSADSERS
jgi:hypothetical protein